MQLVRVAIFLAQRRRWKLWPASFDDDFGLKMVLVVLEGETWRGGSAKTTAKMTTLPTEGEVC